MGLQKHDLAILTARCGATRFGAGRFGFIPCAEDVEGSDNDEPGEYVWKEQTPASQMVETPWVLQHEDCVCRNLCTLELTGVIIVPNDYTNRWPLNEESGTRDEIEDGFDLTDIGGVTADDGIVGRAAKFTRSASQYLRRTANGAELYPQGDYMLSLWFFASGKDPGAIYTLVSKNSGSGTDRPFFVRWFFSSGGFSELLNLSWTGADAAALLATTPDGGAPVDQWSHLAFGYSTSDKRGRFRLNGGAETFDLNGPLSVNPVVTGTCPFLIGASNGSGTPSNFFQGLIDDVRLYDYVWDDELTAEITYSFYVILRGVIGNVMGVTRVNWGDGQHETEEVELLENGILSFAHRFDVVGDYTITVQVTDERGCSVTAITDVEVVVAFSVDVSTAPGSEQGTGFAEVVFTYAVTGGTPPYSYSLAWTGGGGGGPNTDENPTIVFSGTPGAPETIPFTLTVTDDLGAIATFDGTVDVVYEV